MFENSITPFPSGISDRYSVDYTEPRYLLIRELVSTVLPLCFSYIPVERVSTGLVYFVLRKCSPGRRIGNLQAARVASEPLPRFMRGFAPRVEVEAILAALTVSSCLAWAALAQRRRDTLAVLFCLRLRLLKIGRLRSVYILIWVYTYKMNEAINQLWINPKKRRYYRVYLCIDLFGDIFLQRTWGSLNTAHSGSREELLECWQSGLDRLEVIKKQRSQRGYETQ